MPITQLSNLSRAQRRRLAKLRRLPGLSADERLIIDLCFAQLRPIQDVAAALDITPARAAELRRSLIERSHVAGRERAAENERRQRPRNKRKGASRG